MCKHLHDASCFQYNTFQEDNQFDVCLCVFQSIQLEKHVFIFVKFSFICSNCDWLVFLQIFKLETNVSTDGWCLTWNQLNFLAQHRTELEQWTFLLLVIVLLKRDLSECKNHLLKSALTLDGLCERSHCFRFLFENVHCIAMYTNVIINNCWHKRQHFTWCS